MVETSFDTMKLNMMNSWGNEARADEFRQTKDQNKQEKVFDALKTNLETKHKWQNIAERALHKAQMDKQIKLKYWRDAKTRQMDKKALIALNRAKDGGYDLRSKEI
jgi:hypothetical protein